MREETEERRRGHARYRFITAGALIGLGVGLLVGYAGPGVMIGLGPGFLASGLAPVLLKQENPAGAGDFSGRNVTMLLLGIFMILVGVVIIRALEIPWPYLIAGFLIAPGSGSSYPDSTIKPDRKTAWRPC